MSLFSMKSYTYMVFAHKKRMSKTCVNKGFIFLFSLLLTACISTAPEDVEIKQTTQKNKRATLADLTDDSIKIELESSFISRDKRAEKLAALYQAILTLNPDPRVRKQIEYRSLQLSAEHYENSQFVEGELASTNNDQELAKLIDNYRNLLVKYPDSENNEEVQYQLAKALDLQGSLEESLIEIERLLQRYPQSKYTAELNFRRGDIYYNFQEYDAALNAYQAVLNSTNNDKYQLNSRYMSAWSLFKLNRLSEADNRFIQVLNLLISQQNVSNIKEEYRLTNSLKTEEPLKSESFDFSQLESQYASLAEDVQRVLSISFSQQQQSKTLVALLKNKNKSLKNKAENNPLELYQHLLFKNLADFLIKKELKHDAELTYLAYIDFVPNSIWAARFTLNLLDIYQQKGDFPEVRSLKVKYVNRYGKQSDFWQQSSVAIQNELIPQLHEFSYQHSRRLYAKAQELPIGDLRVKAFIESTQWLNTYLDIANLSVARKVSVNALQADLLADEFLYADANFEAHFYSQALKSYEKVAYVTDKNITKGSDIKNEAAYATTLTIRKILLESGYIEQEQTDVTMTESSEGSESYEKEKFAQLLAERSRLDKRFIKSYPHDIRSLAIATQNVQFAFNQKDYLAVNFYSNFVLQTLLVANDSTSSNFKGFDKKKLSQLQLKQVQISSQIKAHSSYQQTKYAEAEQEYLTALNFVKKDQTIWQEMRNLLASSIYFQGQQLALSQPKEAVKHFLRVGQVVPESKDKVTAEFDAANLLLNNELWQSAVEVLIAFQQHYPQHIFSASIPAKLAKSYQELGQWELAADQLLSIVASTGSNKGNKESLELNREAQYSAGEYYLKAGNLTKAITTFRTYAHTYPEPFDVAQEVRFKMSEFYKQTKEPNKRYFWFRKIVKHHNQQVKVLANKGGVSINPRSTFLASTAALSLGEAHQQTFNWTKLKLPLNKTLKRKQKSMKEAINYFQQVLSYQLAEFVPQATFQLGEMYRQLAADVMSSQRPTSLDELALEEYEILLEEIAYPFEEKAIEIHANNAQRSWKNIYDKWIASSFTVLAELDPVQYNKVEKEDDAFEYLY